MGTQRTSLKDVMGAIQELTQAIAAQNVAPNPVTNVTETKEPSGEDTIQVDGQYLSHMTSKVQDFADSKGEDCILYARKNGRQETKLAYCLASNWTTLKDRGVIGAVKHLSPTS